MDANGPLRKLASGYRFGMAAHLRACWHGSVPEVLKRIMHEGAIPLQIPMMLRTAVHMLHATKGMNA